VRGGRAAACVALACLVAAACACSPKAGPGGAASTTPGAGAAGAAAPAGESAGGFGFTLTNYTGTALRGVYISPSASGGWEENILGGGANELADGASVEIRFSPEEKAEEWDMRVVGVDDRYAIWKGLRLARVSSITLNIDMAEGVVVVAEAEE
jgi:hypothetical protein